MKDYRMRRKISLYALIILCSFNAIRAMSLEAEIDSLIKNGRFASAHLILWKINQSDHATDWSIGMMVLNALENHYQQTGLEDFFLADGMSVEGKPGTGDEILRARFQDPEYWLDKGFALNPESGILHFCRGFLIQKKFFPTANESEFGLPALQNMEKEIARYYEKAYLFGFRHRVLFRFLGDYYMRQRAYTRAVKFYSWLVKDEFFDPEGVLQLAWLKLKDGEAQRAQSYVFMALPHFSDEDVELRYLAYRIIANSNQKLGASDKFFYYNKMCQMLIPQKTDAYLDLMEYYEKQDQVDSVLTVMKRMFLLNPFEGATYEMFVYYAKKGFPLDHLIKILDEIGQKYEKYEIVLGYVTWKKGDLYYLSGDEKRSEEMWQKSRQYFSLVGGPRSKVIRKIGDKKRLE